MINFLQSYIIRTLQVKQKSHRIRGFLASFLKIVVPIEQIRPKSALN